MIKKISAILLIACMLLQVMPTFAVDGPYTPGPITMDLVFDDPLEIENATIDEGTLSFMAGGKATFDVLLRAEMVKADIVYKASLDTKLTFSSDVEDESYEASLPADATTASVEFYFNKGSHRMTLEADNEVQIEKITFTKRHYLTSTTNQIITNYTPYEEALQTTVVVKENANAIKVNGAFRYIDYDDVKETPVIMDGKMYLPVKTAARALSLYYEDYSDLSYVLLSNDDYQIFSGLYGSYVINNGKKTELGEFVVYRDGEAYAPLRQLAEMIGRTVDYKDGFAIIDDRICVKNIMNSEKIFEELKQEMAPFEVSTAIQGKTYYVDQSVVASDSNDGSKDFPFATIQHAANVAQAGDTVIIREGVYREEVKFPNDGTATSPIIFRAEGKVTLSAMEKVSGFIPYDEEKGIYQAKVNSIGYDTNLVLYNGEMLREGHHPNKDTSLVNESHPEFTSIVAPIKGDVRLRENGVNVATSDIDLDQDEKDYWKGGLFATLCGSGWNLSYAYITSSEKGRMSVQEPDTNQEVFGINRWKTRHPKDYGWITHHLNTVDMPGEWYINDETGTMFIIPPEGVKGEDLEVEIKQRTLLVDMTDRKYVQLVGINTVGGTLTMAGDSEMCVLNGGTHRYTTHYDVSLFKYQNGRENVKLKIDNPERGLIGFFAHGVNNAFINTDIRYSAGGGIVITGTHTYIDNNIIMDTGYMGSYVCGIHITAPAWDVSGAKYGGHTVVSNTIGNSGRSSILIGAHKLDGNTSYEPLVASELAFNHVFNGSVTSRDTGVVYTYGVAAGNDWKRTEYHHNIGHDNITDAHNSPMHTIYYFDGYSGMYDCYSNIGWNKYPEYTSNLEQIVFTQHGGDTTSSTLVKNNVNLRDYQLTKDDLQVGDFPGANPYYAGGFAASDRFMLNYNAYKDQKTGIADEGTVLGNASFDDDNLLVFNDTDATLTLDGYTLSEKGNKLNFYYASDLSKYNAKEPPVITVDILKNGEVARTLTKEMNCQEDDKDLVIYDDIIFDGSITGDVSLRVNLSKDYVRLAKIIVEGYDFSEYVEKAILPFDADIIRLGSYDSAVQGDYTAGATVTNRHTKKSYLDSYTDWSVHNTWTYTYGYLGRTINKEATKLSIGLGTSTSYMYTLIKVRKGSPTGEVIAELNVKEEFVNQQSLSWSCHRYEIELDKPLPAGTYDIYVCHEGIKEDGKQAGCTDSYYMAFHN